MFILTLESNQYCSWFGTNPLSSQHIKTVLFVSKGLSVFSFVVCSIAYNAVEGSNQDSKVFSAKTRHCRLLSGSLSKNVIAQEGHCIGA